MKCSILLIPFCFCLTSLFAEDEPEIKGQRQLTMDQGGSITLQLADLIVDPNDTRYPDGFYLEVLEGDHYSYSGRTVTPDPGFSGELKVHVRVNNGHTHSKKFNLKINVWARQQTNAAPVIAGQFPVVGERGKPIRISLNQLIVVDPDNQYPRDFALKILPGDNYTINGDKITSSNNAPDILVVNVMVNDGKSDSNIFGLKIVLQQSKNAKPVITGQAELATTINKPITLQLNHLTVSDPDNSYPADFRLFVFPGQNYSVNGTTVTPATNFTGMLTVNVRVNDGQNDSDSYPLKVNVTQENKLRIVGQKELTTVEDSTLTLVVTDLIVNDPNNQFPNGFSITVLAGDKYVANSRTIQPVTNFFGTLKVNVQLSRGAETLPYTMLVSVVPVNDPPELIWDTLAIQYTKDKAPLAIASEAMVADTDDPNLQSAEIGFSFDSYQDGSDQLYIQPPGSLTVITNKESGVYYLVGDAPLSDYQQAVQSIQYEFKTSGDTLPISDSKLVYIKLFDGQLYSETQEREIAMLEDIPLEIPTGFTPNADDANDTWYIKPLSNSSSLENAVIRVFTKHGVKVFEAIGFEKAWDGRLNGELLPADSYFYTIEINSAFRRINKGGVVTLLR